MVLYAEGSVYPGVEAVASSGLVFAFILGGLSLTNAKMETINQIVLPACIKNTGWNVSLEKLRLSFRS